MRAIWFPALFAAILVHPEASWAKSSNEICNTNQQEQLTEARQALELGDSVKAVRIWTALAIKGDAEAQLRLGQSFKSGVGVERDESEYLKWVTRSANQSCLFSMKLLSMHFFFTDPQKSFYWDLRGASLGDRYAQHSVALAFYYGRGVDKRPELAKIWYEKAANQGSVNSQFQLGEMWENGEGGLPKSLTEAARWYKLAANGGSARAQFRLGQMYSIGQGVPLNLVEAHKWFNLSASSDDESVSNDAKYQRYLLEFKMSRSEIEDARKASANFVIEETKF
jgi:TPR repeat protein